MGLRKTLILALLVAGLGIYLYFWEVPAARHETEKEKLLALDPDQVSAVTLTYPDREIHLERGEDDAWRVTAPLSVPADATTVKNLLRAISDAELKRRLEDVSKELDKYGLDKPSPVITLQLKDGTTLPVLKVGKKTPVGFSAYAQKGDDPTVYVTTSAFQAGMQKELTDLRDKSVVSFTDSDVQRIELSRDGEKIVVERHGENWKITAPAAYAADPGEVRTYLSSLRTMRALEFVDQPERDLTSYGLKKPRLTISLDLGKDAARKTLLVGKEGEVKSRKGMFVKRGEQDTIYLVGQYIYRSLDKKLTDFRDKRPLPFDKDKAQRIEITRADGEKIVLARSQDKKWTIAEPAGREPKEYVISRFVQDLAELRGHEIAADDPGDLSPFGLDQPEIAINIFGAAGKKIGTLLAAKPKVPENQETKAYLTAEGGHTVIAARQYVYGRIDKKLSDFAEPEKEAEEKPAEAEESEKQDESGAQ